MSKINKYLYPLIYPYKSLWKVFNNTLLLATSSTDHTIIFWNLLLHRVATIGSSKSKEKYNTPLIKTLEFIPRNHKKNKEGDINNNSYYEEGEKLAMGGEKHKDYLIAIYILDIQTGKIVQKMKKKVNGTMHLKYLGDNKLAGGHYLEGSYNDHPRGIIVIWDVLTGNELVCFPETKKTQIDILYIAPDTLITVGEEAKLYVWDTTLGTLLKSWHTQHIFTRRLMVDPLNEKQIMTCSSDGCIRYWEKESGKLINTITKAHKSSILNMGFIGYPAEHIVTTSRESSVGLWGLDMKQKLLASNIHNKSIYALEVLGDLILTGGMDNHVCLVDIIGRRLIRTGIGHSGMIQAIKKLF